MPNLKPYLVLGLALGGVFALSSIGIVVVYRATAVLNLAGGAVGAMGALIAWSLINSAGVSQWIAFLAAIVFAGALTLTYGAIFGPAFAQREPEVKMIATLGLLLALFGVMSMLWTPTSVRSLDLPTTSWSFKLGSVFVNGTQLLAFVLALAVTAGTAAFLRWTNLGTAMRSLADDRQTTAMLGVPVRRVEAVAWGGAGILAGLSGLLLANLVVLDASQLTFLVVPALAAALVGRLESLWLTLAAAIVIGVVETLLTPLASIQPYQGGTPFVIAIAAVLWLSWRQPRATRV
jgi:branched-chain amino acid transport system permease protein